MKKPWNKKTRAALFAAVTEQTGVSRADLVGRIRTELFAGARQLAFFVVRRHFEAMSLEAIGKSFGNRDHGTVLHGVRKTAERLEHNTTLRVHYCCVCEALEVDPVEMPTIENRMPLQWKPRQTKKPRLEAPMRQSTWPPDVSVKANAGRWRERRAVKLSDIQEAALESVEPYGISSW